MTSDNPSSTASAPALKTLGEDGTPPASRMDNAQATIDLVLRLMRNDDKRGRKRALVDGLVDGNPPFSWRKLREANRADATNVNFGTARSYLETAAGAFYDLYSQAAGYVQIQQTAGSSENQRAEWSRIMSAEADAVFEADADFENDIQLSQNEMVLHFSGPLFFEDEFRVFPIAVETGDLLVPSRTRSKVSRWELATILWDYYPPELYEFIQDEEAAAKAGWDVEYTKEVIQTAMDEQKAEQQRRSWEWYQTQLKSNAYTYYEDIKICRVGHVFWKEFAGDGQATGRVTHVIVQRQPTTKQGAKYLFFKQGRYEGFSQCIHPMYYDRGRGGYHHNVTGLGVKLYGPMEHENRSLCTLMERANAPKTLLIPGTANQREKMQMTNYGHYAVLPVGTTVQQNFVQGFIQEGLAMFNTSSQLMRSNLSMYRQTVEADKPGNPETAFQQRLKASEQSSLSSTTYARYYRQLDGLYAEIVRRLFNPNSTDARAQKCQRRCREQGVRKEAFGRIESARAVRVIGQGSPFMRQQVTSDLMAVIGKCSEDGQNNWLNDFISSRAGSDAAARYNPQPRSSQLASDQMERAKNQVVAMKLGLPATATASQDPLTFAATYMQACVEAIQSVQQGAALPEVVQFLDLAGPAAKNQLQRLAGDPVRQAVAQQMDAQWKRISAMADKLKALLTQQMQQAQAQRRQTQATMSDEQLKTQKLLGDEKRKNAKLQQQLQTHAAKTRQQLALADASTASTIKNQAQLTAAKARSGPNE